MKIPFTIPKVVLRAFTRKLDEEALKKSYEGRVLISEDATWDKTKNASLAQQCVTYITDEFLFYNKLLEYFNELRVKEYDQARAQWEKDLAEYIEKRTIYETRLKAYELALATGDDEILANLNFDDDFDDDAVDDDTPDGDLKTRKPKEPEKVDDEFPEYVPIVTILDHLIPADRIQVVEDIDLDMVPLALAIKIIPDDYYWERLARDRWKVFDITDHNNSWRRLYMEKHAWDAIERFHPADDDFDKLKEELQIVGPEVIRLHIQNVIPICFGTKVKEDVIQVFEGDNEFGKDGEFDEGFGDEQMFDDPDDAVIEMTEKDANALDPPQAQGKKKGKGKDKPKGRKPVINNNPDRKIVSEDDFAIPASKRNPDMDRQDSSHLDFSEIFSIFTALKELTIVYEMVETGMDWEERYFRFTDKDCQNLAKALVLTPTLEKFELLRSRVTGEQCKTLVREALMKLPHLKVLNFNYNRIGDVGARAVARLLIDEKSRAVHTIHTVKVARNRIHNRGGKALAYALTRNRHLSYMDARLNSFGDPVGIYFGNALVKNTTLIALFLGANKFTNNSAYVIGKMLYHNRSLRELDVSSNDFGKKGGEFLALGMRNNKLILRMDVRLCNIGLDFEYDIGLRLKKNRNRLGAANSILEKEWYFPNDSESATDLVDEALDQDSDEDEEGEEEEQQGGENDDDLEEDEDEEGGSGIMVGHIAAQAFIAAGISGERVEIALRDLLVLALLAKAVGVGTADLKTKSLLKNTRRAMKIQEAEKNKTGKNKDHDMKRHKEGKGKKEPEKKNVKEPKEPDRKMVEEPKPKEPELKVVKEPQQMKASNHAIA